MEEQAGSVEETREEEFSPVDYDALVCRAATREGDALAELRKKAEEAGVVSTLWMERIQHALTDGTGVMRGERGECGGA